MNRHNKEAKSAFPEDLQKKRKQIFEKLEKISVQTSFTEKLLTAEPLFLKATLGQYSIPFQQEKLPHTFFIPQKHLWKAEKIIDESLTNIGGKYLPIFDFAIVILTGDPILDTHSKLHESSHALGERAVWRSGKYFLSKVGYSYFSDFPQRPLDSGNFLEETTADFIATKAAVPLLHSLGVKLPDIRPERHIAEYSGGRACAHMRDCLIYLSANIPELLPLFLQARFDSSVVPKLAHVLHRHYGKGALQTLNRMHSRETLLNDELIMLLKKGEC